MKFSWSITCFLAMVVHQVFVYIVLASWMYFWYYYYINAPRITKHLFTQFTIYTHIHKLLKKYSYSYCDTVLHFGIWIENFLIKIHAKISIRTTSSARAYSLTWKDCSSMFYPVPYLEKAKKAENLFFHRKHEFYFSQNAHPVATRKDF